jgi:HD-GYP domain-containing protein (c-di-GMP phosphodiesterase class II)
MADPTSQVDVIDAVKALAFIGDLSMGQPIDHSLRTAWIASRLAAELGLDQATQANSRLVALLRWSGCTANAPEFSDLMGDDVRGREAMLAATSGGLAATVAASATTLTQIHCEVSGDVARSLNLNSDIEQALRNIFETFDGHGLPNGLRGEQIPVEVHLVTAAGDLDIFSRVHGLARALQAMSARTNARYPASMVAMLHTHAADWLHSLEEGAADRDRMSEADTATLHAAPLELIADVIDLKLPWLTGYSRKVACAARQCSAELGLAADQQQRLYRAGLIHGLGRASVPNAVWEAPDRPSESAAELLRLVPYWTARAVRRIGHLGAEAEIASFVDERIDGSGAFRGVAGTAISTECQALAAAAHWTMLRTTRPGRPGLSLEAAATQMWLEARQGHFAERIVQALIGVVESPAMPDQAQVAPVENALLSAREVEVLSRISHGDSNKEAARTLGISPSTVRAHLENIFRKLDCSTRAAATLKAMKLGLFA